MTLPAFFSALRELGPRFVVVTDGRHGAFVGTPDAILFCPALECDVAGTAGAGDAFNAAYLAARLKNQPVKDAVAAARRLAAVVVQHPGAIIAKASMPDLA